MLRNGAYAKVWNVEDKGKYSVVEMSVSRKNKETDKYETKFSSKYVRFIGAAHSKIKELSSDSKIKVLEFGIENGAFTLDDGTKKRFENILVFDIESADGAYTSPDKVAPAAEAEEDDLPF